MSKSHAASFEAQYKEEFPESLLERYIPIQLLNRNDHSQTFLLQEKQSQRKVVAKRFENKNAPTNEDLLLGLKHEGLPVFLEKIEDNTATYILREYVKGMPLDEYAQRHLTQAHAVEIAVKLCDILFYLHGCVPPVIHRDIKPSNIIIDPRNAKITLIDFDIARKFIKGAQNDTMYMGTHRFSPPEQYGFSQTDNRADIYALGVLLFWLLTGETDIANMPEGISSALKKIIKRCTAFDPQKRYKNIRQVKRELKQYDKRCRPFFITATLLTACLLFAGGFATGRYTEANIPVLEGLFGMNQAIAFDDSVLEQRVRENMRKPEGDITAIDALKVSKLDLSSESPETPDEEKIKSINALAHFKNLKSLQLDWNAVSDVRPLADLIGIEKLHLNGNGAIMAFTPLAGLKNVKDLMLVGCYVNDRNIEVFKDMSNLEMFWAESRLLKDLSFVKHYPRLKTLVIKNCGISDITSVAGLDELAYISLEQNPVQDLTPLLNLPSLGTVLLSEDMHALADEQLSGAQFSIEYK